MTQPAPPTLPDHDGGDAGALLDDELGRLRRTLAQRDDILSIAAHELRNPLHAMALHLALARALAMQGPQPELAERLARAEQTLKRYSERVTVLMDLLTSGAGYPLHPREIDVHALLRALADSLDQEAHSRGIVLDVHPSPGCRATVDPLVLEQVVDNLVLNAFKHSGATLVGMGCRIEDGDCVVAVQDNGRGIAAADRAHVFDKFAVATQRPRGAGNGLGLWIVDRLVRSHGGAITLREAPGGGCLFEARIPAGRSPHDEEPRSAIQ